MPLRVALFLIAVSAFGATTYTVAAGGGSTPPNYDLAHLQAAMNDAASNQDGGSCASAADEYIISITGNPSAGNYTIPNKTCAQYIRIRSSAFGSLPASGVRVAPSDATNMVKITASITPASGNAAFATVDGGNSRYWSFQGLEVTVAAGSSVASNTWSFGLFILGGQQNDNASHTFNFDHFEILSSYLHGNINEEGPLRGVNIGAGYVTIKDSYIAEVHAANGDSQAVLIAQTPGNCLIRNNYLAASGENILIGGTGQAVTNNIPSNCVIIGNHFDKPYSWAYYTGAGAPTGHCMDLEVYFRTSNSHYYRCGSDAWADTGTSVIGYPYNTKGMLEFKYGANFQVFGNVFTGGWLPQSGIPIPGGSGGIDTQPCNVFLFNQTDNGTAPHQNWITTKNIGVFGNQADYCTNFSTFGAPDAVIDYAVMQHDITVHDNLQTAIGDGRTLNQGGNPNSDPIGTLTRYSYKMAGGVDFYHDSVLRSTFAGSTVRNFGYQSPTLNLTGEYTLSNNITAYGFYGFVATVGNNSGCALINQLSSAGAGTVTPFNNIFTTEDAGATPNTGAITFGCNTADAWAAGMQQNALVTNVVDSSTHLVKAAYQNSGTDGRDPGATINLVNWATAGASAGTLNTALDYQIISMTPAAGNGMSISFNGCDSSTSVTWELSTDPNLYASPVAVSSQSGSGQFSRTATWNAGTLVGGSTYYARATCGGKKLEFFPTGLRASAIAGASVSSLMSGRVTISGRAIIH